MFRLRKSGCDESFESEFSWGRVDFSEFQSFSFELIPMPADTDSWSEQCLRHIQGRFLTISGRERVKNCSLFFLFLFFFFFLNSVSVHDAHDTSLVQFPFKNTHHFC